METQFFLLAIICSLLNGFLFFIFLYINLSVMGFLFLFLKFCFVLLHTITTNFSRLLLNFKFFFLNNYLLPVRISSGHKTLFIDSPLLLLLVNNFILLYSCSYA